MESNKAILNRKGTKFVMVTKLIMEDGSLRSADKSVYAALCLFSDNKTSKCWPGRDSLMRSAGVSDRTLRNSLKKLEDKGYIEIVKRYKNNGGQLSNAYVLLDV